MPITISTIYRYPVKGLSPERLSADHAVARTLLARGPALRDRAGLDPIRPAQPKWLPKRCFAMLMRDEKLARLDTRFDPASGELTVAQQGDVALRARITEPTGSRAAGDFFGDFLAG